MLNDSSVLSSFFLFNLTSIKIEYILRLGHAVAQLVEALRYKSEGRAFDSQRCHWNFSLTKFVRPHYGPGVDSASNRNEYQEYFLRGEGGKGGRCVGLTTLPPSYAGCLEIWEPQPPGTLRAITFQTQSNADLYLSFHWMLGVYLVLYEVVCVV